MRIFVLCLALAYAYGQSYPCADCSADPSRENRVACRVYCQLDINGDGNAVGTEFSTVFSDVWGCPALPSGCTLSQFMAAVQDTYQMCETEVEGLFTKLSGLDQDGDPSLLQSADMDNWHRAILIVSGASDVTPSAFNVWFHDFYLDYGEPTCPVGW